MALSALQQRRCRLAGQGARPALCRDRPCLANMCFTGERNVLSLQPTAAMPQALFVRTIGGQIINWREGATPTADGEIAKLGDRPSADRRPMRQLRTDSGHSLMPNLEVAQKTSHPGNRRTGMNTGRFRLRRLCVGRALSVLANDWRALGIETARASEGR